MVIIETEIERESEKKEKKVNREGMESSREPPNEDLKE